VSDLIGIPVVKIKLYESLGLLFVEVYYFLSEFFVEVEGKDYFEYGMLSLFHSLFKSVGHHHQRVDRSWLLGFIRVDPLERLHFVLVLV